MEEKVGELIRIELNEDTGEVNIVLQITDNAFKNRILHNAEYQDLIKLVGKNVRWSVKDK